MPIIDDLGLDPEMPREKCRAADPKDDVTCVVHRIAEYTQRLSRASRKSGSPFAAEVHTIWLEELNPGTALVNEIARRLRIACAALGKTATDLADELGVSPQAFNNYVTGDRPVRVAAMIRLSDLHGITLEYIYRGSFDGMTTMVATMIRKAEVEYAEGTKKSEDA